jgi:hypothetical protein
VSGSRLPSALRVLGVTFLLAGVQFGLLRLWSAHLVWIESAVLALQFLSVALALWLTVRPAGLGAQRMRK